MHPVLLGELNLGEAAAWMGGSATVCTAIISGAVVLAKLLDNYRSTTKQQKRIDALEAHAASADEAYFRLAQEAGACQGELDAMHATTRILYDFAARSARALRGLGGDPGEMPPLPLRPPRPDPDARQFRERSIAQQATLVLGRPPTPPSAGGEP